MLIACLLVLLASQFPIKHHFSRTVIAEAATAKTPAVLKGVRLKQEAFAGDYVPFYGTSELPQLTPLHPSVLAVKYQRTYRPFLLGGDGCQSLLQFMGMEGLGRQLQHKSAVVILSPKWFTRQGQGQQAFTQYYSPLATTLFLLHAKTSLPDRYAASRLLQMATVKGLTRSALQQVAKGQMLSSWEKFLLARRQRALTSLDNYFSGNHLAQQRVLLTRVQRSLPNNYSESALSKLATRTTNSNTASTVSWSDLKSPEYGDFELLLHAFAKRKMTVQFVIPPMNEPNAPQLAKTMYQQVVNKLKFQLYSQGFDQVADFSKVAKPALFMKDSNHLGGQGLLALDHVVYHFIQRSKRHHRYNLKWHYFTKKWQKRTHVKRVNQSLKRQWQVQDKLKQLKLAHVSLVVKNGKTLINMGQKPKAAKIYLINSVQKSLTAALVLKAVQEHKLKLTDALSKFYPDVPGSKKIQIKDLLDMTSGLDIKVGSQLGTAKFVSDTASLKENIQKTVFNQVATYGQFHYTSLNYVYLCGILAKVTGQSYESLFTKTYIQKLHLKRTAFMWHVNPKRTTVAVGQQMQKVAGHKHRAAQAVNWSQAVLDAHNALAAGSVMMSTSDLARVMQYILGPKFLSSKMRGYMSQGKAANAYYNCGFYNKPAGKAANGAGDGYYTFLRISPNNRRILIVQTNVMNNKFSKLKPIIDSIMQLVNHI